MSTGARFLPTGGRWKPVALPLRFHLALDKGDWETAFSVYKSQQYRAPPLDTFDLLKTILYKTGVRLDGVRQRFEQKVKLNLLAAKRAPELVEWHTYWEALNKGDSRSISMSLGGAKIQGVQSQIAVAEACAVLLHGQGKKWHQTIVDEAPYSKVTANNLLTIAAELGRWDLALEMLPHMRVGKGDLQQLWTTYLQHEPWHVGLALLGIAPAKTAPHAQMIPTLLKEGCDLILLSMRLEQRKLLSDPSALGPLFEGAMTTANWAFARNFLHHLVDVGMISNKAYALLIHSCEKHGDAVVFETLRRNNVSITAITVEVLEELRWGAPPKKAQGKS